MKVSPVTQKPYINDAIIGNSSMLVALASNGEILRLWWPHVDTPQHMESMKTGVYVEGISSETTWLHQEDAWKYEQSYLPRTNILKSSATGIELPITVESTDFAVPNQDLLVRHYEFTNHSNQEITLRFFIYASFIIEENRYYNTVAYEPKIDGLVYFRHRYAFALSSANVCAGYGIDQAYEHASVGSLQGDSINMLPQAAIAYHLTIPAGETISLPIYLTAGNSIHEATNKMLEVKSTPVQDWLDQTTSYWFDYLAQAKPLATANAKVQQLYERSLLVFKLMSDQATGSVIAAPEFDEAYTRCGGYAYCWGRDAAYITTAFDRAGLTNLTRQFYRWALIAQDPDGSWQQRHYHDGQLAPSWGLQIDEGGSILWGMYQHYLATGDRSFLEEVWTAVEKGVKFLLSFIDSETGLPLPSNDLWEERKAEHTYSAAAVFGGISAAASIAQELGKTDIAQVWQTAADRLKNAIETKTLNPETNTFFRGLKLYVNESGYQRAIEAGKAAYTEVNEKGYTHYIQTYDDVYDISLVGLTVPFEMLDANDPRMSATADAIEKTCTSPIVGGIHRYEDDPYIGGNPWILTTLWLAQFRIKQGRLEEAKKLFDWAVNHATSLDLLPEQIDKETGETAWVVPLTWSHAMFVLTAHMLADAGQL